MITQKWHFDEACNEYRLTEIETKEDGKMFIVGSYAMEWYNGRTNIPKVSKSEMDEK